MGDIVTPPLMMTICQDDALMISYDVSVHICLWYILAQTIRVIILTQLSSCAVKRVFSQLKLIQDTCGDHLLEDMCQIECLKCAMGI